MENTVKHILAAANITPDEIKILGAFIHLSFSNKTIAGKASRLFPASNYEVKFFESAVTGKYKVVAKVK